MSQFSYATAARQQLSVSPRLQQAVRLLQMSALEFKAEFQQELANNPFLEDAAGDELAGDDIAGESDSTLQLDVQGEIGLSAADSDSASLPMADIASKPTEGDIPAFEVASGTNTDSETDSLADWAELPEYGFETASASAGGDAEADPFNWVLAETSLRDHLHQQVCGATLGDRERLAAQVVIETLDDDGYLRDDTAETVAALDLDEALSEQEIEAGIRMVQQFDPVGVGARTLNECLALQLQAMPSDTPGRDLALRAVSSCLDLLARREHGTLQNRLDCSAPSLAVAQALIRRLDPKPGRRFTAERVDFAVPDVIVVQQKGKLNAIINPAVMPRGRLNRSCIDMLRRSRAGTYPAMQQQLQEARWLLRNVEQRYTTIKRVADAIIARQRAWFQYGEIALKPLMLREVADELGLHESTLSRATGNKYMATPRGLYEFKHFFSRQLATDTGGTCSATAVRALIREMIESESREAPLSDVVLAKMLTDHGICVARRTVAKYRNQMKMPPAEMRYLP